MWEEHARVTVFHPAIVEHYLNGRLDFWIGGPIGGIELMPVAQVGHRLMVPRSLGSQALPPQCGTDPRWAPHTSVVAFFRRARSQPSRPSLDDAVGLAGLSALKLLSTSTHATVLTSAI